MVGATHAGATDQAWQRTAASSLCNHIGTSYEVVEVVAFLVAPRASWVRGQIIQANAGRF